MDGILYAMMSMLFGTCGVAEFIGIKDMAWGPQKTARIIKGVVFSIGGLFYLIASIVSVLT